MVDLREDPVVNAIYNGIGNGIDVVLNSGCLGSAVILILSAMDTMAYLSMPDGQDEVKSVDFIAWSGHYIRFPGREQLTGEDLYGARCGMLHSYGVRSRMSRSGKCRIVGYMDKSNPPIRFNPTVSKELVLVSVPALRDALFEGIDRFLIEVYKNPRARKAQLVDERLKNLVQNYAADRL